MMNIGVRPTWRYRRVIEVPVDFNKDIYGNPPRDIRKYLRGEQKFSGWKP